MTTVAETLPPPVKPLVLNRITVPGTHVVFTAACFGGADDKDWSLAPMQQSPDALRNPVLADRLSAAFRSVGAQCVYAPNPTKFNAKIISAKELTTSIVLGDGVYMRRNRAVPADGTHLRYAKEALAFSAGGCGVMAASYGNAIVVAHAGRECLLDRHWVKTGGRESSREHVSVVDSMLDALKVPEGRLKQVHAWPLYFIKPENFAHRADDLELDHALYNPAAIHFLPQVYGGDCGTVTDKALLMNLPGIARKQLLVRGVPDANIHMEHQYLADELPTTRNGGGRYLVAVVRNTI